MKVLISCYWFYIVYMHGVCVCAEGMSWTSAAQDGLCLRRMAVCVTVYTCKCGYACACMYVCMCDVCVRVCESAWVCIFCMSVTQAFLGLSVDATAIPCQPLGESYSVDWVGRDRPLNRKAPFGSVHQRADTGINNWHQHVFMLMKCF